MAAPTFIQEAETAFNTTATPKASAAITDQVGDVLVSCGVAEDGGLTAVTPTLTGETFSTQENVGVTGATGRVDVRTAVIGTAGTAESVSVARTGTALWFGANELLFRGSDGIGAAESATSIVAAAPNRSITTTQANSAIVVVVVDWGATDPAGWTWRTVNGSAPTIQSSFRDSAHYSFAIGYYPDAGATGAKATGITNSIVYAIAAVEVKGTTGSTPVVSSRAVAFSIENAVASSRAVKYNVLNAVSSSRAVPFSILNSVVSSRAVPYSIAGFVASSRAVKYDILNSVVSSRDVAYAISNFVASARDVLYDISAGVASSREVLFDIEAAAGEVVSSRDVDYAILNAVVSQRAISYAILNAVVSSRDVKYDIVNAPQSSRLVRYAIEGDAPTTPDGDLMLLWLM